MNSKARAAIAEAKANLARMEQEETDEINENHDGSLFEDPVERWKRENREIEEQRRHVRAERKLREEITTLRQQMDDLTTSQIIALRQKELSEQLLDLSPDRGLPTHIHGGRASRCGRASRLCFLHRNSVTLRTHVARRSAEVQAEQPVEVGNIGKASLQCDIGNADLAFALRSKDRERPF